MGLVGRTTEREEERGGLEVIIRNGKIGGNLCSRGASAVLTRGKTERVPIKKKDVGER